MCASQRNPLVCNQFGPALERVSVCNMGTSQTAQLSRAPHSRDFALLAPITPYVCLFRAVHNMIDHSIFERTRQSCEAAGAGSAARWALSWQNMRGKKPLLLPAGAP